MGSSYGRLFRISTWGESHGAGVGVVVDGCPSQIPLDAAQIQHDLDRRRPGQSKLVTQRQEADAVEILSGLGEGLTLGTPIGLLVRNQDARPRDYAKMSSAYRPSHADYTYDAKYGIQAVSGGGRASARETIGRVAAGAIARQMLRVRFGVEVVAWVDQVADIKAHINPDRVTESEVEETPVRCPDTQAAASMIERIEETRKAGDSIGGVVTCVARGVPAGWGEPVFDKLDAELAKAMVSLPACKGVEIGSGFAGVTMRGSEHNDLFERTAEGRIVTKTNHSGGVQGGISNGMPVLVRVAFKPVATISHVQETVDREGNPAEIQGRGRHDPCVLPRAVPMVEAMMLLVLADMALRQASQGVGHNGTAGATPAERLP